MKAEVWRQIDKFFQAAVELDDARRASYLDLVCAGDQSLRSEIESLLTADSREWDLIEKPVLESAAVLFDHEQPRLTPGQHLGHYEILEPIGKGGMGEVYLARDGILNRNIAIKLLPFDHTHDEGRLQRFRREAETISALNHPNIITIHELGSVGDQEFIATEFVEGETLRNRIKRGRLSIPDAVDIALQTAGALAAAHRAKIIHRDIKPENIMIRPDGYVKVLDFGLAKLAEMSELHVGPIGSDRTDVSSGLLLGTVRYMSPEQASGSPVDARSDIFSLGVVLYEMVTGRPPFDQKNAAKLAGSILKGEPPALDAYLDEVPDMFKGIVRRTLNKDRDRRYQHADELIADLKLLGKEPAVVAKGAQRSEAALTWRRGSVFALICVLALASAMGFAFYKFFRSGPSAVTPLSANGTWTTKASISSARWQAEPAVLNGVLYVAGGWNVCTPFADLQSYDPATDTWANRAPMITARGAHGVGVVDGKLYAVGGFVDCGIYTASVEVYDPVTKTWSQRAPLPIARSNPAVAAINGKIYTIGGRSTDVTTLASNIEYNPHSDRWIERAPMPTARAAAAAAVVRGMIYVIGGQDESGSLPTVEAYDPMTNSWVSKAPMLTSRSSFAVAELNGIIYAFGGVSSHLQVEAYDPGSDTWTVVAQMPSKRAYMHAATLGESIYFAGGSDQVLYVSSVIAFTPERVAGSTAETSFNFSLIGKAPMSSARSSMAVGEIGGMIYVTGGGENDGKQLVTNEAYDPIADRWTIKAPMPTARETRASNNAVVDEKLYVIGGHSEGRCTDLNQSYDPKTDSWSTRAPMPTARCHVAVVTLDGLIYALGGTNTNGSIKYAAVEIYDPSTDAWSTAPPMPTARQDLGATAINGILYTLGGWNPALDPEDLDVVEAYDPVTTTWATKPPLPTPRAGMAVGVLNGSLIVAGGGGIETFSAAVESYDPATNAWTTVGNIPTARKFLSAVTTNNTLYLFGGLTTPGVGGAVATTDAMNLMSRANQRR